MLFVDCAQLYFSVLPPVTSEESEFVVPVVLGGLPRGMGPGVARTWPPSPRHHIDIVCCSIHCDVRCLVPCHLYQYLTTSTVKDSFLEASSYRQSSFWAHELHSSTFSVGLYCPSLYSCRNFHKAVIIFVSF